MRSPEGVLETEAAVDAAYPITTPPDPVHPCQTLDPLGIPLGGVATPSMWSRLGRPLDRSLVLLWEGLGLLQRQAPGRWVTLQYGRIAINAHGWERLRAATGVEDVDEELVGPPASGWQRIPELWEALRVRLSRRKLIARLQAAEQTGEELLLRAAEENLREIDTLKLSRGLLDDRAWIEILLPCLGLRLLGEKTYACDARVQAAVAVEQRSGAEIGRRFATAGMLSDVSDVAYLTVEERIRAANESSPFWMRVAKERRQRVDDFLEREIPDRFWGLPRVDDQKNG
jgi:hypothetical protein